MFAAGGWPARRHRRVLRPHRRLGARHVAALCVGMVIGAGIFKTAPMVAQSLPDAGLLTTLAVALLLAGVGVLAVGGLALAAVRARAGN